MKKKLFLTTLFLILQIVMASIPGNPAYVRASTTEETPGIQPHAENIGYKYKIINGRPHKRLWSYTKNKWLEPGWTPVS